ncbi:MAG: hypothetical protein IIY90_04650, partial [Oscillospiraceae bacterium]|nr:hypothetical protein [Oscillospiraceae bacterium]
MLLVEIFCCSISHQSYLPEKESVVSGQIVLPNFSESAPTGMQPGPIELLFQRQCFRASCNQDLALPAVINSFFQFFKGYKPAEST